MTKEPNDLNVTIAVIFETKWKNKCSKDLISYVMIYFGEIISTIL
jgi:hypothetical protein